MVPALAFLLAVAPFETPGTRLTVLLFARTDCPVSNRLAPEVNRVWRQFRHQADFWLVYPGDSPASIERHRREYGYEMPAVADPDRRYTRLAGANVTPEAAIFNSDKRLLYRGRLDDSQADFRLRRQAAPRPELELALRRALQGQATKGKKAVGCAIPGVK